MRCSLCDSEKAEIIETKIRNIQSDQIRVYKCLSCGVHFLYPYFSNQQLEQFYNGQYRVEYSGDTYYSNDKIKDFFNKSTPEAGERFKRVMHLVDKSHNVLEIGCGLGYFLHAIKEHVNSVSGTEWDENNSLYARGLGIDVRKDPHDFSRQFDRVFMFHVLEHILEPVAFLQSLKNILNKNAIIFIEVPNNEDILLSGYGIPEFRDFYYQSAHVWNFNKSSLQYVFNEAGFKHEIHFVQRYDISNHIHWLKEKVPGGQGVYNHLFTAEFIDAYNCMLTGTGRTDTLLAVCRT